ncbi:MAG: hypothetical protein U0W24_22235 [Bacteroidales bacterium]
MILKTNLKNLVAEGKTGHAIELLLDEVQESDPDLFNNLVLLKARYTSNENDNILGLVSREDYLRTKAQLADALLKIIDGRPDEFGATDNERIKDLYISAGQVDCLRNDGTCLIDFVFHNKSKNGILIHEVVFTALAVQNEMVLGEVQLSANYNLDIGSLKKPGDIVKKSVNQFIKGDEAERFTITLSDKTLKSGEFKKWILDLTFTTSLGQIKTEPVQVYLPWDLQESGMQPS